jgi:hypothetical protein
MTDRSADFGPDLGDEERRELGRVAERLERDRPTPNPSFRGSLRRSLIAPRRGEAAWASGFRVWVGGYAAAGALCLLVAAIGVAGIGPFAA